MEPSGASGTGAGVGGGRPELEGPRGCAKMPSREVGVELVSGAGYGHCRGQVWGSTEWQRVAGWF